MKVKLAHIVATIGTLACISPIIAAPVPKASTAWFTDASIENSTRTAKPANALPAVPGSDKNGVLLTKSAPVDDPLLEQANGFISFWVKPNWNGNDGKTHLLMRIGDPAKNGLKVEKSASGMLRYVMASPEKISASRADVSKWKAGEWHHITVVWMSRDGLPIGLPLWIDKVAVDGPIAAGNKFLNPSELTDKHIWIGSPSADAVMDELVMRNSFGDFWSKENFRDSQSQLALVYRDYFRTAPFTAIAVDPDASDVPSDKRVVNGCPKLFGLRAKMGGKMVRVTENIFGYGNWTDFDAKPYIKWTTSDAKIATVNTDGLVTGKSVGKCKLTAQFRGMQSTYDLQVIPVNQPDLDLMFVERLPRYSREGEKWWPADGEKVTSVAHIANFGFKAVPAGSVVRFELIKDANHNYRLDANEKPFAVQTQVIKKALAPKEQITLTFPWRWTSDETWVRVSVDPANKVSELCEANNERCELNVARALHWGYRQKVQDDNYNSKKINLVGSFSYFDWFNAQSHRLTLIMQDAVYPTTSPVGIKDAVRSDNFYALKGKDLSKDPWELDARYYDGGFPVDEPADNMMISAAIVHEFGHTCIALPDLYGYPTKAENVFLKDESGKPYSGGELLPEVAGGGSWLVGKFPIMLPSSQNVECGVGYTPLMDFCHLWLDPCCAGQVQYFAKNRGQNFWGVQGRLMPSLGHTLKIYDINDKPLTGAAVYVYHTTNLPIGNAGAKYFADRPKFVGNTDKSGRYIFPGSTDEDWDDADTDAVDGAIDVWNPFGRVKTDTACTPSVAALEGLCLIKVVSNGQTELHWLPLSELNIEFYSGHKIRGTYPIKTSLQSSKEVTPVVKPTIPEAIKRINLKPVAVATEKITVKCGSEFTIDGTKSYDPEDQPLYYRWFAGPGGAEPAYSTDAIYKGKAPKNPGEIEFQFLVNDGLRVSEPVTVKIIVEK